MLDACHKTFLHTYVDCRGGEVVVISEPVYVLVGTLGGGACLCPVFWAKFRCWDVLLKPTLDAVASKRQAKAPEPQVMLKWLHSPSGGTDMSDKQ